MEAAEEGWSSSSILGMQDRSMLILATWIHGRCHASGVRGGGTAERCGVERIRRDERSLLICERTRAPI